MKKVILSAAALMFGMVAFAQNTSDVAQTGIGNDATVDQVGQNESEIDQEFTDNIAIVDQTGDNKSTVNQEGVISPSSGNMNNAQVTQDGGTMNRQNSVVDQRGDENNAIVNQVGEGNDSAIGQGGLGVGNGYAENNDANVDQKR